MKSGTIKQLKGELGSGLTELIFEDGTSVLLERNYGARQLFNAVYGLKHPVTIQYEVDKYNVMIKFEVV